MVSQRIFAGVSWSQDPSSQDAMFAVFRIVRQLHEMLWYLDEAKRRTRDSALASDAVLLSSAVEAATHGDVTAVLAADVERLHGEVRALLMEVSEEVRASYGAEGRHGLDDGLRPGADLMGARLANRRLCGADLRGAYLIGANLEGSDLTAVDVLGADLRNARLHDADLSCSLYLTQPQINSAQGSGGTLLPERLATPAHWIG
ncbi:pentapeptide repeat-containing protein [Paenarthrobacter sp. NPDC089322]|uniref:pentapeptide repeat-containing protein n=1 Tax=Paenarthrobacter sp. NPDC089322 TaxID=3155065 RepID=UPI0034312067